MKKNLLIVFVLFTSLIHSQKSGLIVYEIKSIDFISKLKNPEIDALIEIAKKQTFDLRFNNNLNSQFSQNEIVRNENYNELSNRVVSLRFTCDYKYYLNNQENVEYYKKNDGTLIKNHLKNKSWEITTETKTIDKYLCYKAIYKYDYKARDNKTKTRIITAWFAPSLPFSYGPLNYNGLPGLILELTNWDTTYLATKIYLFNETVEIEFPKGKTITQEEYDRKVMSRN